jgi:hypothetical protein
MIEAMNGLYRGLNHALSNRVNTLNTLLAVLQESAEFDPEVVQALAAEEARFEALLHLYRQMPLELGAAREPMVLADPVKDALALFEHHLDLRMLPCQVDGIATAPPVRAQRQLLTQALLVLFVGVGRSLEGDEDGHGLVVSAVGTDDEVSLEVRTSRSAEPADGPAWPAVEWLSSLLGAVTARGVDDQGRPWGRMTLPTLAAERKKGR